MPLKDGIPLAHHMPVETQVARYTRLRLACHTWTDAAKRRNLPVKAASRLFLPEEELKLETSRSV